MNKLFYLVIATLISAGTYAELNVASAGKTPPVEKKKNTSRKKKSKNIQTQQEDPRDNLGNLAILPDEVLCQIFGELQKPKDALNVAKTNKYAHSIISNNQSDTEKALKIRMKELPIEIEEFYRNQSTDQNKEITSQHRPYELLPNDIELLKRTFIHPKNFENFYYELLTTEDGALRTNKIHILTKILNIFPEHVRFLGKKYPTFNPTNVEEYDLAIAVLAQSVQVQDEIRKTHDKARIALFATPQDPEAHKAYKEFPFTEFLELSQDSTKQRQLKSYLMSLKLLSGVGDLYATAHLTKFSNQFNEYLNVVQKPLHIKGININKEYIETNLKNGLEDFIRMYPWFAYTKYFAYAFENQVHTLDLMLENPTAQLNGILDLAAAEKFADYYFETIQDPGPRLIPSKFWNKLAEHYELRQDLKNRDRLRIRQIEGAIGEDSPILALYGIDRLIKDQKHEKALKYLTAEDFDKALRQEENPSATLLSAYWTAMAILNLDNPQDRLEEAKKALNCTTRAYNISALQQNKKKLPSELELELQNGATSRNYTIIKKDILTLQLTLALYQGEFDKVDNFLKEINLPFEEKILRAIEHQLKQGNTLPEELIKRLQKDFSKFLKKAPKHKILIEDADELAKFREILEKKYPMAINLLSGSQQNAVEKTINTLETKAEKVKIKKEKKEKKKQK